MRIQVTDFGVSKLLSDVEQRQLPFATSKALNQTALDFQRTMRESLPKKFTIRSGTTRRFLERMIKIEKFDRSNKHKLSVTVGITGPGFFPSVSDNRAAILARHEKGGTFTAFPFYLPAPGLRGATKEIPRRLYPSNLRLAPRRTPTEYLPALRQGKRRTFIIPGVGIFQRQSKDEIDSIWFFKERVTIKPRLGFYDTATKTVEDRWAKNFADSLAFALRTAR
ncbi:MAG TPA: hypothetical protein VFK04_12900 [Gemmatimonadaceae bacterium]|nr:hypothetical protein [Gemmatimonadaceae bacterium]